MVNVTLHTQAANAYHPRHAHALVEVSATTWVCATTCVVTQTVVDCRYLNMNVEKIPSGMICCEHHRRLSTPALQHIIPWLLPLH